MRVKKAKLLPTSEQAQVLLATMRAANAAKNMVAHEAPKLNAFQAQNLLYGRIRAEQKLGAQAAVRAIADACTQRKKHPNRTFRPLGSIAYDTRNLSIKRGECSIWTLDGRKNIPFANGSWRPEAIDVQCRLEHQNGMFFLAVPIEDVIPEPRVVTDYIGVDLGVVNIAVDSDKTTWSGRGLDNVRRRYRHRRQVLQAVGTRSAKRRLRKIRQRESRFSRDVNHVISRRLVDRAQDTGRGIALEDLSGIRERLTVRKSQRARLGSWAFAQLRTFVEYKAAVAGVPVVPVDPRNTSRTCPCCGHVAKENRRTRDWFHCVRCGHEGPADEIAAENIRRAAANRPIVTGDTAESSAA